MSLIVSYTKPGNTQQWSHIHHTSLWSPVVNELSNFVFCLFHVLLCHNSSNTWSEKNYVLFIILHWPFKH